MNALNKAQISERLEHAEKIRTAYAELESAIERFNEQVDEIKGPVEEALSGLNDAIADADGWLDAIRADMDNHYDEKSERWQEGEKGQAYLAWKDQFFGTGDRVEVEFPDALDVPSCDLADTLESLPDQP